MRRTPTAILRARFQVLCRAIAVRQVLGIMTVLAPLGWIRTNSATAQGIGTMQVEARVIGADSEWSSLEAAQRIAADLPTVSSQHVSPSRIALSLSQIQWATPGSKAGGDGRPALVSVQYLRN